MLAVYLLIAFFFKEADVSVWWWVAFWATAFVDFLRSIK